MRHGDGEDTARPEIDRRDLRVLLLDSVPKEKIRWGPKVENLQRQDDGMMSIRFADGTTESGFRLVVGADGLWSTCRSTMLGKRDTPMPTGDLAYRVVLNIDQVKSQKLRDMVQNFACRFWAGPDSHVVAYSMRSGKMYNIVLLVPDDLEEGVARTEGDLDEMKKLFEDWDPV